MTPPPGHNLNLDRFVARLILWKKPDDLVTLKNPDRKLPITAVVCANGRPDLLKKLIKAGATHSLGEAMFEATFWNAGDCVSILLDAGIKPTKRVLDTGLSRGDWELIFQCLQHNPELGSEALNAGGLLDRAMLPPRLDVVRKLLEMGANVNRCGSDGVTPLLRAVELRPPVVLETISVVKLLLKNGANPNAADRWGTTALMMAAGRGVTELVTLLLDAGADPSVRNQAGQSAEGYARLRGHEEIADRLTP